MALEERPVLTYKFPSSHPQKGFIRTRIELVAPNERPWNQALSVCLAVSSDGPVIFRERLRVNAGAGQTIRIAGPAQSMSLIGPPQPPLRLSGLLGPERVGSRTTQLLRHYTSTRDYSIKFVVGLRRAV